VTGLPPIATLEALSGRIAAAGIPRVSVELPLGEGWFAADELASGDGLETQLDGVRAWASTDSGPVAGALFLDAYVWCLSGAAAAALLLESAIPDLRPSEIRFRFGENGRATAVAFTGGVLVAPRESELLGLYRAALVDHLEPLIARLHLTTRRASAAFWRNAGDMAAFTLVWCGRELGDLARGASLARRLLASPTSLGRPRSFHLTAPDGTQRLTCVRHGCCLWLRTPHGTVCAGCPVRRAPGASA
jgi:ferric iron reductase protein FhuF